MSATKVPVVLARRAAPESPTVLEAPFSVLVSAAPVWFGLRGMPALSVSDMDVQVGGRSVEAALVDAELALAPLDLRLPERETIATYLGWVAALDGRPTPSLRALAQRFRFEPSLGTPICKVPPHVRRAVAVAAAHQTGAKVLVLEDPLAGLPVDVAEEFTRVLASALEGRQVLWLAPRLLSSSALSTVASEVLWFHGSACVRRGSNDSAIAESCKVSLVGPARAFAERLSADGVEFSAVSEVAQTSTWLVHTRSTWRIFAAATDVGATVTELEPLLAFA